MRTATTLAITHDGKEVLLAGRTVGLLDQKELVKKIRHSEGGARFHKEYASLTYQESDGHVQEFRFLSPAQHEEREKQKAIDNAGIATATKVEKSSAWKPGAPPMTDGPTVTEYVLAGYDPKNYPPTGYASRSTPAEIEKAIADYNAAPEGDEQLALAELGKAEGIRKELLGKDRAALMKLATETKAKLPLIRTKTAIVDAILATGYTGK